jgi:Domain of unknown function (DUF5666)
MKTHSAPLHALRSLLLALAAFLASCGGGVGTGGTGGDATAYASGPITGFGSVFVGGVRFDDSAATVEDADGGGRSRDDLRLGMTVEVDSSAISTDSSGSTASARRIQFESEIQGLVGLVNVNAGTFTVLGQTVLVDATTVFDDRIAGGLAGLSTGQGVEVYAVFDAAALRYRATRVEPSSLSGGLRLRGPVRVLDTAAQTLTVGSNSYSYAGANSIPAGLAVGQFVRLRMALDTGRWVVRSFGAAPRVVAEGDGVKVEGLVSALTSSSLFSVNGRAVDASAATLLPAGTTGLVVGARVEVEGVVRGGVFVASKVKVVSDTDLQDRGFELIGSITAVNVAQSTITLRGVTVSTARSDLRIDNGTLANLVVGQAVEVKGGLAADRRTLEATRIKIVR